LVAALLPAHIYADGDSVSVDLSVNVVSGPVVYTLNAIGVGTTKATLCGWLADLGTDPSVLVSFGWDNVSHAGDPAAYSNWTVPQVKTKAGFFKIRIEGLTPGTTYYFRAKAVGDTTVYGREFSFRTHPGCFWWWGWWWYFHWR
jgi:hypothetical protein